MTRIAFIPFMILIINTANAEVIQCKAKDTLTAIEMNCGDILLFTLDNGDTRRLEIIDTQARVLLTNLKDTKKGRPRGGTVYQFTCSVLIDGQPMTMLRYVPTQESFYEPYVVNGLRIWFDGVKQIGELFNENHGDCVPKKDVRFAFQDAERPIAPQILSPWYPNTGNALDVHEAYNGDDVWMGTYFGSDLHGGLDINMPIGTPLWAPFDLDDHFYFNSIDQGHNNNRWRAIRRWPNGDRWTIQVHHLLELLVPEHTPLKQGSHFAAAAGELTGSHAHSHFVFKIGEEGHEILLDPWILFWRIFENNREKTKAIRAHIAPLSPAKAGERINFSSVGSRPGPYGYQLTYCWTFGDGGCSNEPNPTYAFAKPGLYPVTLTIADGAEFHSCTQHITITGTAADKPAFCLFSKQEPSFFNRPSEIMDVYGCTPSDLPHTLHYTARPKTQPKPRPKILMLSCAGASELAPAKVTITYHESKRWLSIEKTGEGAQQRLIVSVDASRMKPKHGVYHATVNVTCPGALNPVQVFRVQLTVPRYQPEKRVVIDTDSPYCYVSPYFWLSPRFHSSWCNGYGGSYLTNGHQQTKGKIVRYQPDLAAGEYDIYFTNVTPFQPAENIDPDIGFFVKIDTGTMVDTVWMQPLKNRKIGTYDFEEGRDGYVQIITDNSKGLIVADAVVFERKD